MSSPDVMGGSVVTHIDELRVRHEGRWVRATVAEAGPQALRVSVAQPIPPEGELQVVLRMLGDHPATIHLQAEKIVVRRDGRGSQITLRLLCAFCADGRPPLVELVTRLLGRGLAVERALADNSRGSYYDFSREHRRETVPITRRGVDHAICSASQVMALAHAREGAAQPPPGPAEGSEAGPAGRPVRARTAALHGVAVRAPNVLSMSAHEVDLPIALRAYGTNLEGHIYRVTTDGHRVFVSMDGDLPALWDTVWFYLRVDSPTGPRSLHARATVVLHLDPEAGLEEAFAARLVPFARADDQAAWRRTVDNAARDAAAVREAAVVDRHPREPGLRRPLQGREAPLSPRRRSSGWP